MIMSMMYDLFCSSDVAETVVLLENLFAIFEDS